MKQSSKIYLFNRVSIIVLLSGSLLYHARECFRAKQDKDFFQSGVSATGAALTNTLLPSSSLSYIILSNQEFIKP